ncbi:MAG TPA: membrane dipeptidase, partial [Pyrinomonadaceae bacterium]|nr:membrane dipeptidase [Pyrinomonadaceae bacterium]
MKRLLSLLALIAVTMPISVFSQKAMTDEEIVAKAEKIHLEVITLDTHNDIDTRNFTGAVNYTQDLPTQVNLPKMRAGGLDVSWMIVYTGQGELTEEGYKRALENAWDKFDA